MTNDARNQGISNHDISLVTQEYVSFNRDVLKYMYGSSWKPISSNIKYTIMTSLLRQNDIILT